MTPVVAKNKQTNQKKKKTVFIEENQVNRTGSSCLKDQHSLMTFREKFLEATFRVSVEAYRASLVAQMVRHLPTMWETRVQSLGWEDLLEKEMTTHSSILAWKIPWMEETCRLQSVGSQRVGDN